MRAGAPMTPSSLGSRATGIRSCRWRQRVATPNRSPPLSRASSIIASPSCCRGGTALLFAVASGGTDRIAVQSLETGERQFLMEGSSPRYVPSGHLVFAREDSVWGAPFNLNRLQVTGDPVPVLEGVRVGGSGFAQFAVADNGSLVYVRGRRPGRADAGLGRSRGTGRPGGGGAAALHGAPALTGWRARGRGGGGRPSRPVRL